MGWIKTDEAAKLLSDTNKRPISAAYVRTLASKGAIESKPTADGKHLLVKREDVENRVIHTRSGRRVEQRVRDKRSGRPGGRPRKDVDGPTREKFSMIV